LTAGGVCPPAHGTRAEYRKYKRPFPPMACAHLVAHPASPEVTSQPFSRPRGEDWFKRLRLAVAMGLQMSGTVATLWHTRRPAAEDWYPRWDSEHGRSESLVRTRASVQDAAKARDVAHGQPRGALGRR